MLCCCRTSLSEETSALRRGPKKYSRQEPETLINEAIRASEIRVITDDGENLGVISRDDALARAKKAQTDLILISPNAKPPVAKIGDYGKYRYEQQKKAREVRAKSHTTETKNVQVKIGTGEHDLELKARRASEWLEEGHRVKVELYLRGRAKYLDKKFLHERLERFLKLFTTSYRVAEDIKKSPKGIAMIIERDA